MSLKAFTRKAAVPFSLTQDAARWGLLLASVLLIYLRAPALFHQPRFWAEEGAVYFQSAYAAPLWSALANTRTGYINLWPSLSTYLAAHLVPLESAPAVTLVFALLAQLAPAAIILWSRSPLWNPAWKKLLGLLAVLFIPYTHESWLNTVNSQLYFQLAAFLILMDCVSDSLPGRWLRRIILAAGGLTGVLSALLAPLFFLRWFKEREKERLVHALVLTFSGVLQLVVIAGLVLQGNPHMTGRLSPEIGLRTAITILWNRCVGLLFLGREAITSLTPNLYPLTSDPFLRAATPLALLAVMALIFWLLARRLRWDQKLLWLGGFFLAFTPSVLFYVGSGPAARLIYAGHSPRYFITATAILMLLAAQNINLSPAGWQRWLRIGVFALVIFWGVQSYTIDRPYGPGWPVWSQQVARWREDASLSLEIWPPGWSIHLPSSASSEK